VFSALTDAQLSPLAALRVMVSAVVVSLAVLASLAPITVFFTLTTSSYPFMKLLNVFFFAAAAFVGLGFLLNMLRQLDQAQALGAKPQAPRAEEVTTGRRVPAGADPPPLNKAAKGTGRTLFQAWLVVYALVGAQMAWVLRPFIGAPKLPFEWFRPRGGNVFTDVLRSIGELLTQ
jgi:hypothetical protein